MKLNRICPFLGAMAFFLLSCNSSKKETSFKLTGNFTGVKGEGYAILQDYETYKEDTVPFIDGKFEFVGKQDQPKLCRLYFIGPNDSLAEQFKSDLLYIENANITCSGNYKDLMFYLDNRDFSLKRISVQGGKMNKIYNSFLDDTRSIVTQAVEVTNKLEYPEVAVENMSEFQYNEMLQMQTQLDSLLHQRDLVKEAYIQKYADTQLGYDFVFASLAMDYHYEEWFDESRAHGNRYPEDFAIPSSEKVESWISLLEKQKTFTPDQIGKLKTLAKRCKQIEHGAPFMDGMVYPEEGDSLLLSTQLKEGRYTLIDCWASWCHPCRASIPHLKQLHNKYKELDIIGISLDGSAIKNQWLKAIDDEGMSWPQFMVEYNSELLKAYNISAIPNIILITPDKKIYKTGVRGFDLDLILKRIYGY